MVHIRKKKKFKKVSDSSCMKSSTGKYCLWASPTVLCNVSHMKCQGGNIFEDCCCFPVAKLCPTLCDPMDCSMPGLPVHHQLLEFTQTHVHRVGDAIQPSHPLSPTSLLALNLSQHQGLFQWVSSLHQLELQLQHHTGIAYWEKVYASFFLIRMPVGVMTLPQYMQPHSKPK